MTAGACSCSSSRISTLARDISHASSQPRLQHADVVAVTDVYAAREEPVDGVSGKLVVDALAERRPGMDVGVDTDGRPGRTLSRKPGQAGRPRADDRGGRRRPGGDASPGEARVKIEQDVSLSRFTTLGTGGEARAFARPETLEELQEALAYAGSHDLPVAVIGLGSNLLVADEGFDGLALKLVGELAQAEVTGELLVAGGGAPNAVALHRARAAGLGGFEFACAIPGTAGGGVWMNAGAYGSDWAAILDRALVVDGENADWRTPDRARSELPALRAPARSGRREGRVSSRRLGRREEIKAIVGDLQAQRKAAQPTNKRTFGSVFKNPEHELSAGRMLEACGLKGHRIGGAQISPRHANFIENASEARSADAIALMAEARRRASEQFGVELQHEVEFLGPLELPRLTK